MPYCHKCGFEVGAWMSYCPRCGTLLRPTALQSRRYGYRVTAFLVPQALLWFLLASLWILRFNLYDSVPWYSQFLYVAFGLAAGVAISAGVTRKQLNDLTEKSEISTSPYTLMMLVGGALVFTALFLAAMLAFPSLIQLISSVTMDFLAGTVVSLAVGRTYLMLRWERTHKMHLYQKWWSLKVYAVPDAEYQQ
jgi:hypothetical protein